MGWSPESSGGGLGVLLGQSGVAVSHTGDTNETVLATIPVPANLLGKNGQLVLQAYWSRNSGGTSSGSIRVRFGASGAGTGGTLVGGATVVTGNITVSTLDRTVNTNATNSQVTYPTDIAPYGLTGAAFNTAAINTTAATEIVFTGQLGNSGDTVTLVSYQVLAYPHA